VFTNQIAYTPDRKQAALETLVIAQLAALWKRESELRDRLQSTSNAEPLTIADEVWQLQNSADRLNRMIDAMTFGGGVASFAH
jgi:hypothetical protein